MHIILYADERTEFGKEAIKLLSGLCYLLIPTAGGLPEVSVGVSRYVGLERIQMFLSKQKVKL